MTERQRFVTRQVTRLSRPTLAKYYMHFMRRESDGGARRMIADAISQLVKETGNTLLTQMGDRNSQFYAFGAKTKKKESDSKTSDKKSTDSPHELRMQAATKMSGLLLEDALALFKRIRHLQPDDQFYAQRAEIHLVQGRPLRALKIAELGRMIDMAFVSAIAAGDFMTAKKYVLPLVTTILAGGFEREGVVSLYEVVELIMTVMFATGTCAEVEEVGKKIINATTYTHQSLANLTKNFTERHFSKFWNEIKSMKESISNSLYIASQEAADTLLLTIRRNLVLNVVRPYAVLSLNALATEVGERESYMMHDIMSLIREKRLTGKCDLVDKVFRGSDDKIEANSVDDIYVRTQIAMDQFQSIKWRSKYLEAFGPRTKGK